MIQLSEQEKQGWTMRQIADELGVNKMRVYRTISRLNLSEAFKKGQTLYFDQTAKDAIENAIQKSVAPTSGQSIARRRETTTSNQPSETTELLTSLNDRVKAQQTQIETLTRLLDQSQRLQLVAEQRTQKVEKQVSVLQEQIGSPAVATLSKKSGERNGLDPDYFDKEQTSQPARTVPHHQETKVKIIQRPKKQAGGFFKGFWQKPML
ncbi:helix-turn-helix domain-containing protein [Lentilactobacillus raoultii]|uniref:Helix-turn-helix domain-containing protein n=1 Tax=Lentilactobacillus raoultii TaxID=1987503 RepID=A0ABW3PPF7_9LACO|nr:helix-turn-helix domain-containing protein [Lentilactobacillus raoultii]